MQRAMRKPRGEPEDGSFVVVRIQVVGRREQRDHRREALRTLAVHLVPAASQ